MAKLIDMQTEKKYELIENEERLYLFGISAVADFRVDDFEEGIDSYHAFLKIKKQGKEILYLLVDNTSKGTTTIIRNGLEQKITRDSDEKTNKTFDLLAEKPFKLENGDLIKLDGKEGISKGYFFSFFAE